MGLVQFMKATKKPKLHRRRYIKVGANQLNFEGKTPIDIGREKEILNELEGEKWILGEIDYLLKDQENRIIVVMGLERYYSDSGLWFIHREDVDGDYYDGEGMPKADDYEFGYYGVDTEQSAGSHKFVVDRCNWAKPQIEENIRKLEEELAVIKKGKGVWF